MAETLDGALAGLFAEGAGVVATVDDPESPTPTDTSSAAPTGTAPPPGAAAGATGAVPASIAQLATRAREHYDRARAAQRSDDWAAYGTEMRRLGEVLRQLEAARAPRP
jgi:uncharacterized membrane protein (UPF0182 family)